jgi:hypothetical protein
MKKKIAIIIFLFFTFINIFAGKILMNVTWNSPSDDTWESMPLSGRVLHRLTVLYPI